MKKFKRIMTFMLIMSLMMIGGMSISKAAGNL